MSANLPSWIPPFAGSEVEHLLGALDRMRATFRWKADGLDAAGLAHRIASSELSIGGLLMHLALVEDEVVTVRLDGSPRDPFWAAHKEAEHDEFIAAADHDPETLYRLYDEAVRRAQHRITEVVADGGLGLASALKAPDGQFATLRRLLFDLLEEYGRHTGHTDLLREAVDGRVGEDPPIAWEPFA